MSADTQEGLALMSPPTLVLIVTDLLAENERLREALRVVASNMLALEDGGCDYPRVVASFSVATAALARPTRNESPSSLQVTPSPESDPA